MTIPRLDANRLMQVAAFDMVVFGGTGDLAMRKLMPALLRRDIDGQIAPESRIISIGRSPIENSAYARRVDLPKLQRSPSLACDDAADVWSIPCFFVKAGFRGKGIARALLRHALRSIRLAGGRTAEAYPVQPPATNASAFTGTVPFLESEGFVVVTSRPRGRQRARRSLA